MSFRLALLWSAVACVTAAPSPTGVVPLEKEQATVIPILSQFEDLEANGTYKFSYETGNGITREETSYNKIVPQVEGRAAAGESSDSVESNEIHVQEGSFSYVAPDGTVISLRYTADENGFRPVGDHLPTPPPFVRHQINYANEKSGRSLKFKKAKDSESSSAPVTASVVTEKKADIVAEGEELKETKIVPEKKSEGEAIVAQQQEVKETIIVPEKKTEVKVIVAQPEEVKETNIVPEKKSAVEALVAQQVEAKETNTVPENNPVAAIVFQSEKAKETTTGPEKKPEIAAIDLAISVNPLKESNVVSSIKEIPSLKVSLTTAAADSSANESAKSEGKKTSEESITLVPETKDASSPQVTEVKVALEKKPVAEEPPSAAPEKSVSGVALTPADKVVVELEKSPEKPETVDSTQSNSKTEEKSTVGESV